MTIDLCRLRLLVESSASNMSPPMQAIVPFGFEVFGKGYLELTNLRRLYIYVCPLSRLANSSPDIEVTFLRAFLEQLSLADPDFLRTIRYLITPQNVEEVLGWEGNPMDARQITVESIPLAGNILDEYSRYMSIILNLLADWRAPECFKYEYSHRSRMRILQLFLIARSILPDFHEICTNDDIPLIQSGLRDMLPVGYNIKAKDLYPPSILHDHIFQSIIMPGLSLLRAIFKARTNGCSASRLYSTRGFHSHGYLSAFMDSALYGRMHHAISSSYLSLCPGFASR
jgi:hypothetical protein